MTNFAGDKDLSSFQGLGSLFFEKGEKVSSSIKESHSWTQCFRAIAGELFARELL